MKELFDECIGTLQWFTETPAFDHLSLADEESIGHWAVIKFGYSGSIFRQVLVELICRNRAGEAQELRNRVELMIEKLVEWRAVMRTHISAWRHESSNYSGSIPSNVEICEVCSDREAFDEIDEIVILAHESLLILTAMDKQISHQLKVVSDDEESTYTISDTLRALELKRRSPDKSWSDIAEEVLGDRGLSSAFYQHIQRYVKKSGQSMPMSKIGRPPAQKN